MRYIIIFFCGVLMSYLFRIIKSRFAPEPEDIGCAIILIGIIILLILFTILPLK